MRGIGICAKFGGENFKTVVNGSFLHKTTLNLNYTCVVEYD